MHSCHSRSFFQFENCDYHNILTPIWKNFDFGTKLQPHQLFQHSLNSTQHEIEILLLLQLYCADDGCVVATMSKRQRIQSSLQGLWFCVPSYIKLHNMWIQAIYFSQNCYLGVELWCRILDLLHCIHLSVQPNDGILPHDWIEMTP